MLSEARKGRLNFAIINALIVFEKFFFVVALFVLMSSILKEVWLWIIIFSCIAILVGSIFIVWIILQLPEGYRAAAVIALFLAWGVAAGYKDYLLVETKD